MTTLPGPALAPLQGFPPATPAPELQANGNYVLIGWNDLGMHCMGPNYSNFSILPPYNTVWAQLILRGPNPQILTQGFKVEYSVEDNTYSVGKTNFWDYAQALFGVNLAPNIGLKGNGLQGEMESASDHFIVEGIPITQYRDSAPQPGVANWYPYQIGHLTARTDQGVLLAEARPVVPVSDEMHCEACHADGMQEDIATGNVETNILTLHDMEESTHLMQNRPVLCQACHADNALGAAGQPGVPNLSRAMHEKHKLDAGEEARAISDPDNMGPSRVQEGTNNCYLCHPGTTTKCLRDVMWQKGLDCRDCHGNTAAVGAEGRNPWVDLPRCGDCHTAEYAENPGTLYRNSKGHGGLYCEACHGSPHAILPSSEANDNIQNTSLQGYAGTLDKCTVCHTTLPAGPGPHKPFGATATPTSPCVGKPDKPILAEPKNGARKSDRRLELEWSDVACATSYNVVVRVGSSSGNVVDSAFDLPESKFKTKRLARNRWYYWRAEACNDAGCSPSRWRSVFIRPLNR
jgi:hypothetical protein